MNDRYGTVAGFRDYHAARGNTISDEIDNDKINAALLVGSEFIDYQNAASFPGTKTGRGDQLRQWPRTGAFDRDGYALPSDVAPVAIDYATYEAAAIELNTPSALLQDFAPNKYKSVSITGAVSVVYADRHDLASSQTVFARVNMHLATLRLVDNFSSLSGTLSRT